MPIYEYVCAACEHEFETIQKFSDDPLQVCPECEAPKLAKKISAAAFHLKGSGWYETDFKDKNKSGKSDGDSDSGGTDKSADTKSSGTDDSGGSKPGKADKSKKSKGSSDGGKSTKGGASSGKSTKSGGGGEPSASAA